MEPPTCLPVGSWGTGFHHRRLSGLRSDDAFPGQTWQRAYPIEAVGRTHDDRPADARAESGVQPDLWIFRRQWLGIRRLRGHQARRHRGGARPVWLGRWPGHLLVFRPQGGDGHHPDDSVRLDVPQPTERLFLDPGVPSDIVGLPNIQLAMLPGMIHVALVERTAWLLSMITSSLLKNLLVNA